MACGVAETPKSWGHTLLKQSDDYDRSVCDQLGHLVCPGGPGAEQPGEPWKRQWYFGRLRSCSCISSSRTNRSSRASVYCRWKNTFQEPPRQKKHDHSATAACGSRFVLRRVELCLLAVELGRISEGAVSE